MDQNELELVVEKTEVDPLDQQLFISFCWENKLNNLGPQPDLSATDGICLQV